MENIKMRNVLGSQINNCLVISVEDEVKDESLDQFCNNILDKLERKSMAGSILDFSRVSMLDTYAFNKLNNLTRTMQLMGTSVVWSQLSPGVASCLIDFGMDTSNINFSSTIEEGIRYIEST